MLRGYIATAWSDLQEKHYKKTNSEKEYNRQRWENELINHMTKMSKAIWKERRDVVKLENEPTKDSRTRETVFLLSCDLQKEAWKLPAATRSILRKPKNFFYDSHIDQILNWEQSVAKALKSATPLAYKTKSKITSWITRQPNQRQNTQHMITSNIRTTNNAVTSNLSQHSLLTYLTTPKRRKVSTFT